MNNPRYIVIHCTDVSYRTAYNQFNSVNIYHRDVRDFPISSHGYYVGYHVLITGDTLYECRKDTDEGAHCNQRVNGISMNFQSLGVCVGFDGDIEMPTPRQYELLQRQVWAWQDKYKIPNENVKFHRVYATDKTCPGSLITDAWLKDLLKRPAPVVEKPEDSKCAALEKIIIEQKGIIANLQELVRSLIRYFKA